MTPDFILRCDESRTRTSSEQPLPDVFVSNHDGVWTHGRYYSTHLNDVNEELQTRSDEEEDSSSLRDSDSEEFLEFESLQTARLYTKTINNKGCNVWFDPVVGVAEFEKVESEVESESPADVEFLPTIFSNIILFPGSSSEIQLSVSE
eukprot:GHVH01006314.1.p1 GENE.GHVH01006314.1~~GHVH01006314.1.p1  ORF type:complete len:148 (-),score=23.69 GHVH01006314.1:131-574(-)